MSQQLARVGSHQLSTQVVDPPLFEIGEDGNQLNIGDYLRVLRRHKWIIAITAVIGALLGGYNALSKIPIYRASASLIIEPDRANLASIEGVIRDGRDRGYFATQIEVLQSRAVADRAVKIMEEAGQWPIMTAETIPATSDEPHSGLKGYLTSMLKLMGLTSPQHGDLAAESQSEQDVEQIRQARRKGFVSGVQGGVLVQPIRGRIVSVSYDSANPAQAANIVNAVGSAYIKLRRESRLAVSEKAGSWLTGQLEVLRDKVIESEAALRDFQSEQGLIDLSSLKELTSSRLNTLNNDYLEAQRQYSELAKRYGPKHPRLIEAQNDLSAARARLDRASRSAVETKQSQFELAKLEQEVQTNRQLYELFLTRINEADHSTDKELSNARILDAAEIPRYPIRPDRKRIVGTWAMIGLIMGIILAFIREQMDSTFKTHEQVEDRLKLPVLGVVPLLTSDQVQGENSIEESSDSERVIPERYYINKMASPFGESINHLRTGITFSNVDSPPKVVLVTSSVQGEGKTTLSSNLALSFSQLGRTLLIDADLRKPRVARVAGVKRSVGLVEYLTGHSELRNCMAKDTESENLYILKSGQIPPSPLELIASEKFEKLVEQFKSVFSHVIIDSAPLLPVSDAMVLSRLVDATILVVKANSTTHSIARDSLRRLQAANNRPSGVVLAQVDYRRSYYYYDRDYYARSYYKAYGEDESYASS